MNEVDTCASSERVSSRLSLAFLQILHAKTPARSATAQLRLWCNGVVPSGQEDVGNEASYRIVVCVKKWMTQWDETEDRLLAQGASIALRPLGMFCGARMTAPLRY